LVEQLKKNAAAAYSHKHLHHSNLLHVACSGTLFHKSNHNNNQNNNTATKLHLINHKMSLAFRAFFLKFMNGWMVGRVSE